MFHNLISPAYACQNVAYHAMKMEVIYMLLIQFLTLCQGTQLSCSYRGDEDMSVHDSGLYRLDSLLRP